MKESTKKALIAVSKDTGLIIVAGLSTGVGMGIFGVIIPDSFMKCIFGFILLDIGFIICNKLILKEILK
jgi:hypothetical protein